MRTAVTSHRRPAGRSPLRVPPHQHVECLHARADALFAEFIPDPVSTAAVADLGGLCQLLVELLQSAKLLNRDLGNCLMPTCACETSV